MAAIRRRTPARRDDFQELTGEQRRHLLRGSTFFGGGFKDRELFDLAWQLHGERLTAEFVRDYPGRRPFGWWINTHGIERPIVSDWAGPDEIRRWRTDSEKFGFLDTSAWCGEWLQEPELEYLRRHGLLTAAEVEALASEEDD